jgi:HK97 family phage prohead protease
MTPEGAKGFCNERHHAVLGIYPATHAAMEKHAVGRTAVTEQPVYDSDGLDASWDDLDGLPDLTGLDVPDFEALDPGGDAGVSRAMPKLGTGARFAALKAKLAARGASNPGALAAYIGRRKYGKAKFAKLAGKARGGGMRRSGGDWRALTRPFVVEDLHIMRAAEGESSGRVVEGYAAVFSQPQEIHDKQGDYTEQIDPHAFDAALARMAARRGGIGAAVRVLFNHGKTIEGMPAPEFQKPIGRAQSVTPDTRGLLTRTEFNRTALAEEVLELIRSGSITGMSFQGNDLRSDPPLRGPGDRYRRGAGGALTAVRRMMLSLFEYSPVVFEAYPGAEFLGVVRMGTVDDLYGNGTATDGGFTADEEAAPAMEGDAAGSLPEDGLPSRSHAHRLWQMRTTELCRQAGISFEE